MRVYGVCGSATELLSVVMLSKGAVPIVIGTGMTGFGTLRKSGDLMTPMYFCSECTVVSQTKALWEDRPGSWLHYFVKGKKKKLKFDP